MTSSSTRERDIAIVGVAESDEMGTVPNKSSLQHHAEAAYNALEDAGIAKSEVNGLLTAGFSTLATAEYMGIQPGFTDNTSVGGSSFVIHVAHAAAAIRAGYCDTVLITHGQAGRSTRARVPADPNLPVAQYESPYGLIGQPINYSMACTRYMHEYGEDRTRQAMAEIAVSTRKWANLNPKAVMHETPMSFDDYHNSRWVSWPFHLFDCCLVTDSGAAIVVTTAEKAANCKKAPVWLLGAAEAHDHNLISQMPSYTSLIARETGPNALQRAGVTHDDIDVTLIYDSFTYTVMLSLEGLGFCGPGGGSRFRGRPAHRSGRRLPPEHRRRRPVLHPPRHVRQLPAGRVGAPTARRMRRPPGKGQRRQRRAQDFFGERHRRVFVFYGYGGFGAGLNGRYC